MKLFSDGEVFGFKCSAGLLFDVNRQICDFKLNVDNCDVTAGELIPKGIYSCFYIDFHGIS
jgi:hypothetical protein